MATSTKTSKLVILVGPDEGKQFPLSSQGSSFIGRSDDNEVSLSDTSVSRKHAVINFRDGVWFVRDESSRNGSFVNDVKLESDVEQKLANQDVLRLGIYELRFEEGDVTAVDIPNPPEPKKEPTQEAGPEPRVEEATEKESFDRTKKTEPGSFTGGDVVLPSQPFDPSTELGAQGRPYETDKDELDKIREEDYGQQSQMSAPKMGKSFVIFLVIAAVFCIIAFTLFFVLQDRNHKKLAETPAVIEETEETEEIEERQETQEIQTTPPVEQTVPTQDHTQVTAVTPIEPALDQAQPVLADTTPPAQTPGEFAIFVDVKTTPLPATIFFGEKRLGLAPLKESIPVVADQTYTLFADYELRELNDIYRKKVEFKAQADVDVVELSIDAELGVLKILSLPRKAEFYLEGFYDYDQTKSNPVKVTDIVYSKPIYLPYGRYVVELREKTQVAGSDNLITQVRYQREYVINADQRSLELSVTDKDLQFFPAVIKSNPSNASVSFGGEIVGTTPFSGSLPLGAHQLKIIKDGYFPFTKDVDMRINSVYELTAELKTSKMGELINVAKEKLRNEQPDQAINTLVEALKYGGSATEKAEVYYLLGNTYLAQKKYDEARPYFEKSRTDKGFFLKATLGLARLCQVTQKNTDALRFVVEALVNIDSKTPRDVKNEANNVLKMISPVKSVMYITSEPVKADVFVNDKRLEQQTPLILSDLGLGNYRLQFEKTGYETYKTTQNLKVGEFVLVKVKMVQEKK